MDYLLNLTIIQGISGLQSDYTHPIFVVQHFNMKSMPIGPPICSCCLIYKQPKSEACNYCHTLTKPSVDADSRHSPPGCMATEQMAELWALISCTSVSSTRSQKHIRPAHHKLSPICASTGLRVPFPSFGERTIQPLLATLSNFAVTLLRPRLRAVV